MKNIYVILFLLVLVAWRPSIHAQSIEVTGGSSFTVNGDTTSDEVSKHLYFKNKGTASHSYMAKLVSKSMTAGHDLRFCWGQNSLSAICYPTTITVSESDVVLAPNESNDQFIVKIYHNGNVGTSTCSYKLYDMNDTTDAVIVTITTNVTGTTAVTKTVVTKPVFSAPYPNPASTQTSFNYELPTSGKAYAKIFDLMGKLQDTYELQDKQGTIRVNARNLNEGMYFCNLELNGKVVATRKFIISK